MPIYEYKCTKCNHQTEVIRRVEERHEGGLCIHCLGTMELKVSLPANAYVSGYPYFDPVLDMEVTDPAHRKRVLKQNGLEERG